MMDFLSTEEYEQETIRLALEGDHEAGREALVLCRTQLAARSLSPALSDYLAARLHDVLEGIKPDRALCIAKSPGKPADPYPDWQQELGAMAALLTRRGYKPNQIARALCDARALVHDKPLDEADAHGIRTKWGPMQAIDERALQHLAGSYWEILKEYPPLK
ncbi:MAG: hypothetical protein D4R98_02535 [Comamonadaceae bacterium]|nr:MAG: hypothetical protein D4R98_02535 [Comamonadaceae bacterium]